MDNKHNFHKTHLYATCILLSVAEADEILEKNELDTICEIISDFFSLSTNDVSKLLIESQKKIFESIDLFEFGQHLNTVFNHSDKIDFIKCIYEIAYSDGVLHYLEHHTVKKIANILNLSREEIINSKQEIKNFYI